MGEKLRSFIFGLIIGGIFAFPLGMNFGRGEPLLTNPFSDRSISSRMKRAVKDKTERLMDSTKEKIHDATRPAQEEIYR